MPALKTGFGEQKPLSEWAGAATLKAQLDAAGDDLLARAAILDAIPEGFKWTHDEVNTVVAVTDDHADKIDLLEAHVADDSLHGGDGGSTAITSLFTTNNANTAASSALTFQLDQRVTSNQQSVNSALNNAAQGISDASAAKATADQAITNAEAAQSTADGAQIGATQALSDSASAQSDADSNRIALDNIGKVYTLPNNTVFAEDEQPTAAEIKAWQVANHPSLDEYTQFIYESDQNVIWLFAMDKDGTMTFLNKHDPGMEGGVYVVPISSPDTLISDIHPNTLRFYRITATSPLVTPTGYAPPPSESSNAVEMTVPLPVRATDKIRFERQSDEHIWIHGTINDDPDGIVINKDRHSVLITAKVDLSGWYYSVAG